MFLGTIPYFQCQIILVIDILNAQIVHPQETYLNILHIKRHPLSYLLVLFAIKTSWFYY